MVPRCRCSAADRGPGALQVSFLDLPVASRCRAAPWAVILAALTLGVLMERDHEESPEEVPCAGPADGAGPGHGGPEGAAPAAGPAAERAGPWPGVTRRQTAEQSFDAAVQPLRSLYRDMSVAMELHRDVDRMRGEAIQLRMEVARLKGTVIRHEDRIKQLGQASRYAQNVANLLPNDAGGAAARGAGDGPGGEGGAAARGAGADPGGDGGAAGRGAAAEPAGGGAGEPPAHRRRLG